jgi:hypothetical protein
MSSRLLNPSFLPHSVGRRLRTLGHALARLQDAAVMLRRRCEKGQTVDGLSPEWFQAWGGQALQAASLIDFTTSWSAVVEQEERQWLITSLGGMTEGIGVPWAITLLSLHLPVLRTFWRKEVRAYRAELLRHVLPPVWPLDPAPLPPGAAISGLNLASWSQLPDLLARGRTFEVLSLTGERHNVTPSTWPEILTKAVQEKLLLVEHRHLPGGTAFTASWSRNEKGWIDLDQQTA